MIVIIGHGASPVGECWGPAIDRHKVVRQEDWHWQTSNPRDYGARVDYVAMWGHRLWGNFNAIKRQPTKGYIVNFLPPGFRKCGPQAHDLPAALNHLPVRHCADKTTAIWEQYLPYKPTRGLFTIFSAFEIFRDPDLVIVGMDDITSGEVRPYPKAYAERWPDHPGLATVGDTTLREGPGAHHAPTEKAALSKFVEDNQINLRVAGRDRF